mgnify:FL=1
MIIGEMLQHMNYRKGVEPERGHGWWAVVIVMLFVLCIYSIYLLCLGIIKLFKKKKNKNK